MAEEKPKIKLSPVVVKLAPATIADLAKIAERWLINPSVVMRSILVDGVQKLNEVKHEAD